MYDDTTTTTAQTAPTSTSTSMVLVIAIPVGVVGLVLIVGSIHGLHDFVVLSQMNEAC